MPGKPLPYGSLLLLVQLAVSCGPAEPAGDQPAPAPPSQNAAAPREPAPEQADTKLVVAFGDSLYAGYNLPQQAGFAPALERSLAARGISAQVVNAGVSGDTTAGGLARLAFTLDGLARKPDLVVVGLGANDMLRGFDPATARANLDAMLAELRRRGIDAALTGMVAAPNLGPDYAAAFNTIYPQLAAKYDVPLYPFFLAGAIGDRALMLPDGLHPNARGIELIVDRVTPMIAERLARSA